MNAKKNHTHFYTRSAAILALLAVLLVPVFIHHVANEHGVIGHADRSHLDGWKLWDVAMSFHLIHAAVLYFLADKNRKDVWWTMLFGIIGFCGGIYLDAITQIELFGFISHLGILTLVLAWGLLAFGQPSAVKS